MYRVVGVRFKQAGKIYYFDPSGFDNLKVNDNGPGIPKEMQERVFEPFVTTKTRGTGLGLAIVKRLVEDMDGQILFRNSEAGGLEVTVQLPLPSQPHGPETGGPP
jgi:signal transduction histidine kinase